ncbi:DUF1883 domain-containing protein [Baekduia sp. Peel2402]|uniref:DUF1883 domain-containing protein n=1 Tax=Baekduia sp. Peel2402 TaxID=3458296 RepID=UPI00403E4367
MPAFVTHDLGELQPGVIVEVTPEQPGNVLLVDPHNLKLYRSGRHGRAIGGPATANVPVRLIVPQKGSWFVIVDRGGMRGKIRAAVRTLDPATVDADITDTVASRLSAQELLKR